MSLLCEVFKSSSKQEMYLYVEKTRGLQDVPLSLLDQFGQPVSVMVLHLTPQSRLARADVETVLGSIERQGFYLQMPPSATELMARDRAGG